VAQTVVLYTVAPLVGAIAGISVHFFSRLLSPVIQPKSPFTGPSPQPVDAYLEPEPQEAWTTPKQLDTYRTLQPPISNESTPTSPLDALLPPDSPLLSRNHHAASSAERSQSRPSQARNISYRTQMRSLMTERQEQLLALHEEEKRRRATQELSPSTLKAHGNADDSLKTKSAAVYGSLVTPSKNRHARSSSLPMFAIIRESGDRHGASNGSIRTKSPSFVHSGSSLTERPAARVAVREGDGEGSFSDY